MGYLQEYAEYKKKCKKTKQKKRMGYDRLDIRVDGLTPSAD